MLQWKLSYNSQKVEAKSDETERPSIQSILQLSSRITI